MKDYPIRMTSGQTFFVTVCFLLVSFITFYLGARFGPEIFWNIQVDRINQETLLPSETSEQELAMLLKEETVPTVTFHEELQKKGSTFGPLDNSRSGDAPLLVTGPTEDKNPVLKETGETSANPQMETKENVAEKVVAKEAVKINVKESKSKQVALNLEKPKKNETSVVPAAQNKTLAKKASIINKPAATQKQDPPADPIQNQIDQDINW